MARNLYITPTEARSGKSAIVLGLMEILLRDIRSVGFFRPIINTADQRKPEQNKEDQDIRLIRNHCRLDIPYEATYAYTFQEARELINLGQHEALLDGVLSKYKALESQCDFILCEGTDFEAVTSAFEFDINVDIANNLGSPVLVIANGYNKSADDIIGSTTLAIESLEAKGIHILAVVVNRTSAELVGEVTSRLRDGLRSTDYLSYVIPEEPMLGKPTMREIAKTLGAEILSGKEHMEQHVDQYTVAAMQLRNFLKHIHEGGLIISPGDRGDIIIGSLASRISSSYPNIAGILLTGGLRPDDSVATLIEGWSEIPAPVLLVQDDTFTVTRRLTMLHTEIEPEDERKIATVLRVFEAHVDAEQLRERLVASRPESVTPKMFEYGLIQKAKVQKQHIVLPEGTESRILKAAEIIARRDVAGLTLLGDENQIQEKIRTLGLSLDGVAIVQPRESPHFEDYVKTYYELRKHKGITLEGAKDLMSDATYFSTMMVYKGHADGMVSGAVNTTQHTIRPAFEFIRTKPGCSIVSSVFFMCLKDKVLVYGDCAVNPNPTAEQLAEIALSAAETARTFGIEPRVAMLSYSSGTSGKGTEVEKVRKATQLAKERSSDLKIEGPIQYDAAIDPDVGRTKIPGSEVAGRATVFIFPDLNTGNNTYKAVQRSAKAVAIGPVLQGLRKPVNDLSRGCTVPDIVNTVAITAIQAQAQKESA